MAHDQQFRRDLSGSTYPQISYHPKARVHVVLMDGTLSTLDTGAETNIGLIYKMLLQAQAREEKANLFYQPGLQWFDWYRFQHIIVGRGVDQIIQRAYGWLSLRYREGDAIYLFGYSRGAFAVRSLCGLISQCGLLAPVDATERNVRRTYRSYRKAGTGGKSAPKHRDARVRFVGAIDTVKAMGMRSALMNRLFGLEHAFHNHDPVPIMERGAHALARDERRIAYRPLLWDSTEARPDQITQMWFKGNHGDVGGHIGGFGAARPLSNVVLKWLLQEAEAKGLELMPGWQEGLECNAAAPSTGPWHGFSKFFLKRRNRQIGQDPSECQFPEEQG